MSERKRIYLCLAHMSEDGMEQKYVKVKAAIVGWDLFWKRCEMDKNADQTIWSAFFVFAPFFKFWGIIFGGLEYYSYFCHRKMLDRLCTSFVFRRYKNLKPSNALIASLLWLCVRKRSFVCNINFKNSCWVLSDHHQIRGRFFDPFLIKGLKYPVRNKSH